MYGKNSVAPLVFKPRQGTVAQAEGKVLEVKKIFLTIQGEGPHAGEPAVFVRLAGCNLRCFFCDTDFEGGTEMTPLDIVRRVQDEAGDRGIDLVVLTGGEPMRQQIVPLLRLLDQYGFLTQIETAGTVWPGDEMPMDDLLRNGSVEIVCSPKTAKIHPEVEKYARDFKYIIKATEVDPTDGLPSCSTQTQGHAAAIWRPDSDNAFHKVWVQPCDEPDVQAASRNEQAAINSALRFGYRLSFQIHKALGLE